MLLVDDLSDWQEEGLSNSVVEYCEGFNCRCKEIF